jgi:hypothetical protein
MPQVENRRNIYGRLQSTIHDPATKPRDGFCKAQNRLYRNDSPSVKENYRKLSKVVTTKCPCTVGGAGFSLLSGHFPESRLFENFFLAPNQSLPSKKSTNSHTPVANSNRNRSYVCKLPSQPSSKLALLYLREMLQIITLHSRAKNPPPTPPKPPTFGHSFPLLLIGGQKSPLSGHPARAKKSWIAQRAPARQSLKSSCSSHRQGTQPSVVDCSQSNGRRQSSLPAISLPKAFNHGTHKTS